VTFSDEEIERYARHLVLSEVGGPGQQRLKAARVVIVGMGGVGGPAALYLAAAGIGELVLIDHDTVALSNLQRQIQFGTEDLDRPKVAVTEDVLRRLNPHVRCRLHAERLTPDSARRLLDGAQVVIDGTDDFPTRFAVNAACMATGIPLVSGALGRWTGQIGVFSGSPCYQCLTPATPPDAETCARVGVMGALAGVVGAMSALEAIKLICSAGAPLTGRLLIYDGLAATARTVRVLADPDCPVCGGNTAIDPGLKLA